MPVVSFKRYKVGQAYGRQGLPKRQNLNKPMQSQKKRDQVILAAEKLFAQEGYHGASMRDIAREAGVKLPLIVYHFETKLNLYKAIFEFRKDLIAERMEGLRKIEDFSAPDAVERIVQAFVAPVIRHQYTPDGMFYAQIVVREAADPQEATRDIIEHYFDPIAKAYIAALQRALPGCSHEHLCWAYLFAVGALVMSGFDGRIVRISDGKHDQISAKQKIQLITTFIASGIQTTAKPTLSSRGS